MKILVATELADFAAEALRGLGCEVLWRPGLSSDELAQSLSGVGILIVGRTRVSGEAVAGAESLQMIVCAGHDVSRIALDEASAQGIFVVHCPHQESKAIAELTMALALMLDRQLLEHVQAVREGRWRRPEHLLGNGLAGRTLGVLAGGPVQCEIARRARAFDMRVVGWCAAPADPQVAEWLELLDWPREVARRSDVVAICTGSDGVSPPVVVDDEFVQSMPPGASLVYVGHPSGIDESALARGVRERGLRAGLDLAAADSSSDAPRLRSALVQMPGVIVTPHLASATRQVADAISREVVRLVREFLVNGEVHNCVNLIERSPATWQLVLRVRDAVGVVASIMDIIRADGINAEEITTRVFTGAKAAWCTIALDERPSSEALSAIRATPNVLHLELRAVV